MIEGLEVICGHCAGDLLKRIVVVVYGAHDVDCLMTIVALVPLYFYLQNTCTRGPGAHQLNVFE